MRYENKPTGKPSEDDATDGQVSGTSVSQSERERVLHGFSLNPRQISESINFHPE